MKNLALSVLVLITVLMSTTGAEEVIYAQVGCSLTLKPPAGFKPTTYLYWLFEKKGERKPIAGRNTFGRTWIDVENKDNIFSWSENSLIINKIQEEHFGTVVAKLTLESGDITWSYYNILKLNLMMNTPSPLLPGEDLSLDCIPETPPSNRRPAIHWLNPQGEKMSMTGRVKVTAVGQYNGHWTCVVTINQRTNTGRIFVTVVDLSPAPVRPQYTSKSSPLTIPCSIPAHISWDQMKAKGIQEVYWDFLPKPGSGLTSGEPQRLFSLSPEIGLKWTTGKDRQLIPAANVMNGTLSLTRNQVREDDSGDYECGLKFRNNVILKRTVHVKVLQFISSPGTELISGQQVNLTCTIGHPLSSDLQLKWFPPKQSSLSLSDHHSTSVIIPEVGTGEGGKWRCELWLNSTQLTSAVIKLKIETRLNVSMLIVVTLVIVILLLLPLVFILYRYRKRKMRHPRHRLCQCKNPQPKGFYKT